MHACWKPAPRLSTLQAVGIQRRSQARLHCHGPLSIPVLRKLPSCRPPRSGFRVSNCPRTRINLNISNSIRPLTTGFSSTKGSLCPILPTTIFVILSGKRTNFTETTLFWLIVTSRNHQPIPPDIFFFCYPVPAKVDPWRRQSD